MARPLSLSANKCALATLSAISAPIFAQSTVAITGLVDLGFRNVNRVAPGASQSSIGAGNNARLAFGVNEDLGGGLSAVFNAQMRFDPSTGTAETGAARPLFQGETRAGLRGDMGTILFGRGLTALQTANGGNADPWGVSTVAGNVYAAGFATDYAAGGEGRIDNAVFYTSPTFSGLTLSGSFSPRKLAAPGVAAVADNLVTGMQGTNPVTAITTSKQHKSLNALYANGPASVGLGYEENRVGDNVRQLYGNYDFGMAKLYASNAVIRGGTAADRAGVAFAAVAAAVPSGAMGASGGVAAGGHITNNSVGVVVPFGALSARAGYSRWNGNGAPGQLNDSKLGFGLRYTLSQRTYLYTDMARQTRRNNTGGVDRPDRNNTGLMSFDLGVSHSF